jgi:propanediol dehydratase small subunit
MRYGVKDYPLAEKHPEQVKGARGKTLADITLDAVLARDVTIEDLRITPTALDAQASVARSAGRPRLADNFERAAELVNVPQDVVMRIYELLRPGRAKTQQELLQAAHELRSIHGARRMADFVAQAAEVYETRGLFSKRF